MINKIHTHSLLDFLPSKQFNYEPCSKFGQGINHTKLKGGNRNE